MISSDIISINFNTYILSLCSKSTGGMSETCNQEEKVGGLDISSVHNLSVFLEAVQIKNGFFIKM
jgi:hypothetical protein